MKASRILFIISLLFASFTATTVTAQTTLINGANTTGTIFTNTVADTYVFTASKGDTINLRLGSTNFAGDLQLFGPTGAQLDSSFGVTDNSFQYVATNSGTFTVLVSAATINGTGTYVLRLAQTPEPFIVPDGDEGDPLANGANHYGAITLGDIDMWTFTASKGDTINLRLGSTNFAGDLQLFGPTGAQLDSSFGVTDNSFQYVATNSGTFTVLVSAATINGTGTYVLRLAQTPEPFIVPDGDEGGPLTGAKQYGGIITLADMDMWSFTAFKGDTIGLELKTVGFSGSLQLFGPTGVQVDSSFGVTDNSFQYVATNSGTFTVLVSASTINGTGTYTLSANALLGGLKVSSPRLTATNLTISGGGGVSNSVVVLYASTNLALPLNLWTPIATNRFDQFGVFDYTATNLAALHEYFYFGVP